MNTQRADQPSQTVIDRITAQLRQRLHAGGWNDRMARAAHQVRAAATQRLAQAQWAAKRAIHGDPAKRPVLACVRDVAIPARSGPLRARVYTPMAAGPAPGPGIVFFHGGGFYTGSLDSHDGLCRRLCAAAGVRLVSVSYRLAPDHKYPAAIDDALDAYDRLGAHGEAQRQGLDPHRLAVAGDSAGGTLAAIIAQHRRHAAHAPVFQLLMYPLLQMVETNPHHARLMEGTFVSKRILKHIRRTYLRQGTNVHDPLVSPLLTEDLRDVAPAYIIATSLDPLQYEGEIYAERLAMEGGQANFVRYANLPHGFLNLENRWSVARKAVVAAGRAVGEVLLHEAD